MNACASRAEGREFLEIDIWSDIEPAGSWWSEQTFVPRKRVKIDTERLNVDGDGSERLSAIHEQKHIVLLRNLSELGDRHDCPGGVGGMGCSNQLGVGSDGFLDPFGIDPPVKLGFNDR